MLAEPVAARIKRSTYKLSGGQPWHVDLTTAFVDKDEPIHTRAIFALDGDQLRYCVAPPGQARPGAFATATGDGLTLVTLRRNLSENWKTRKIVP